MIHAAEIGVRLIHQRTLYTFKYNYNISILSPKVLKYIENFQIIILNRYAQTFDRISSAVPTSGLIKPCIDSNEEETELRIWSPASVCSLVLLERPVGWGCRIHQRKICRKVRPHPLLVS